VILSHPIEGLTDSKQLSERKREALYETIQRDAHYHIVTFDAQTIDEKGISCCLIDGLKAIMHNLQAERYLFDGHTTFGIPNLACQVKADRDIPEVSAASILAKVTRDRMMVEMAQEYPEYGFERHKGYGTKAHIEAIRKYGYSPIHRKSFKVKSLEQPTLF